VSIFFVLSGFVLTYAYIGRKVDGKLSYWDFWVARFARIYPIYGLSILAMFAYHVQDSLKGRSTLSALMQFGGPLIAGLTATQKWFPNIFVINGPSWSISVEAFFYLVFPIAAPAVAMLRWRSLLTFSLLSWLLVSVAPIVFIYANVTQPPVGDDFELIGYGLFVRALVTSPLMRLPEFLLGVCAGRLFLDRHVRTSAVPSGRRTSVMMALGGGILVALLLASSEGGHSALVYRGMLAPLFAVLIYSLARLDWSGVRPALLASPTMVLLGEASYGLYIIQVPVATALERIVRRLVGTGALWDSWVFLGFYLVVVVAAALLSVRLVERPGRRLVRVAAPWLRHALTPSLHRLGRKPGALVADARASAAPSS
jgi:peptidoglycan/LPS O-acetylase OafA/YrhL